MQIPIEQLLNLPDIQVLNVGITDHEIKCDIESTHGYSIWYRCGQKATKFVEHGETFDCTTNWLFSVVPATHASGSQVHNLSPAIDVSDLIFRIRHRRLAGMDPV